jgi:HD superfamily phosphohydrolase
MPHSATVRDPIHGMVALSAAEWKAIDTPVFQRLRLVRQLAMTHLVYPGALHTRFEHSIGVGHEDAEVVHTAALLHDVGHGVFSHVSEQVIEELSGVGGVHEAVSAYVMRNDERLHGALGSELCERAAEIIELRGTRTVLGDIVSGPTDADKLDYLLRDSYFAGVNYGVYDLGRIIDSARIITPDSRQNQLGFDADGLWAVEELLMARHHMHRQVYGHKTRLATDIMTSRALKLGVLEGVLPQGAYRVTSREGHADVDDAFLELYMDQTDARVLQTLAAAGADTPTGDLARRLSERRLLRRSVSIRLDERAHELGDAAYADIRESEVFTPEVVAGIEAELAGDLGIPAHLLAVHLDARTNPTYRNPGGSLRRKDIMLQRDGDPPRLLHSESEIFRDELGAEHTWIYLYTPQLNETDERRAKELLWSALANR